MNIKLIVFFTLILGVCFLFFQYKNIDYLKRNELLEHVRIVNSMVDVNDILNLKGNETDYDNPSYKKLKLQFTEMGSAIKNTRYIYIMAKRNGKTVILIDTQPKKYGIEGLAIPGEEYDEFDNDVASILNRKGERTTMPYTDKWGTFISGLISVVDQNDKVVAMVGIDNEAINWKSDIWGELTPQIIVLILIFGLEIMINRYQINKNKNTLRMSYLASILESSNDPIYSIDFNKKILSWNLGAEKLYGYTESEVMGKDMTKLLLPGEETGRLDNYLKLIINGQKLEPQVTKRKTKSGNIIDVSLILSPIYDDIGKLNSVSVIARDITAQKKRDEELEKHNMELERMNKLMIDRELMMIELKKKIKQI